MEQNKYIFRLMAVVTAVITVAGIVLLMLHEEGLGAKLSAAGSLLLCNGLFAGGMYLGISHPEWNRRYGLKKKEDGRLGFGRIEHAPDPEGLRYRYYGYFLPCFALLMTLSMVFEDQLEAHPAWFIVLLALLCAGIGAVVGYVEYRLQKEQ